MNNFLFIVFCSLLCSFYFVAMKQNARLAVLQKEPTITPERRKELQRLVDTYSTPPVEIDRSQEDGMRLDELNCTESDNDYEFQYRPPNLEECLGEMPAELDKQCASLLAELQRRDQTNKEQKTPQDFEEYVDIDRGNKAELAKFITTHK